MLSGSALLWLLFLLKQLQVTNTIDWLVKRAGQAPVIACMLAGPLILLFLGLRLEVGGASRTRRRLMIGIGGILTLVFAGAIGVPLADNALSQTPPNPSTPRPLPERAGIPVFPGAEGFGTDTIAGRGGVVLEVTSLADHGPGTLRSALEHPNPRTIIFKVGGYIDLEQPLFISHPFVTIAGQSAPGNGITIRNAGLIILSHDVLVQHVRIRPGNTGDVNAETNDAVEILGRHGDADGAYNVVLDHVSASWSEDETISVWYGAHDITISWSIISEGLLESRHPKGTHSAGLLIGDSAWNVSVHHNLMAHNDIRNPLIPDGGTHDLVNNVIYNWGVLAMEVVDQDSNSFLNIVGNSFIPGPSTRSFYEVMINEEAGVPKLFVSGNIGPQRPDEASEDWDSVKYGWDDSPAEAPRVYRSSEAWPAPEVTASSAAEATLQVLEHAGATLPLRGPIDVRIVSEVRSKTGRIINSPRDVGGYPQLRAGLAEADSDHDGMPDSWERENMLDPGDPADAGGDVDGDGYSNLEEYLHALNRQEAQGR